MLVEPQYNFSFKLMGIVCLLSDQEDTSQSMLSTQHFFDDGSHNMVNERNEKSSEKFKLYTINSQRSIELSSERWNIIYTILSLGLRYAMGVKSSVLILCVELREIQPEKSCNLQERGKMKEIGAVHYDLACLYDTIVISEELPQLTNESDWLT